MASTKGFRKFWFKGEVFLPNHSTDSWNPSLLMNPSYSCKRTGATVSFGAEGTLMRPAVPKKLVKVRPRPALPCDEASVQVDRTGSETLWQKRKHPATKKCRLLGVVRYAGGATPCSLSSSAHASTNSGSFLPMSCPAMHVDTDDYIPLEMFCLLFES